MSNEIKQKIVLIKSYRHGYLFFFRAIEFVHLLPCDGRSTYQEIVLLFVPLLDSPVIRFL